MNRPEWLFKLKLYVKPDAVKSLNQLVNTVFPYLILMITLMILAKYNVPYWFLLIFIPVTSCFMVRCFILMHDCSHKSFFRSEKTCAVIGHILGILTFTPFFDWRRAHLTHHVTVGNLEKRGTGDIWTLTLNEYLKSGKLKRFLYQLYRNPLVILGFGPFFVFLISQRFPQKISKKKRDNQYNFHKYNADPSGIDCPLYSRAGKLPDDPAACILSGRSFGRMALLCSASV